MQTLSKSIPIQLQTILQLGRTDPVLFSEQLLGIELHEGQKHWLRESTKGTKINVLVPSNRWGKSTVTAIKQIWNLFYKHGIPQGNKEAWTKAEYRTANVAPKSSLVEPVFKYIDQIMTSSFIIRDQDGNVHTNQCHIEWFYLKDRTVANQTTNQYKQFFAFNAHIEHRTIGATASDSLEGKPYGYISYDEGGRSNNLENEVNGTFLARLFDLDGQLDITSTPDQNSSSILFHYKLYQDGLVGLNSTYTLEGELKDNTFFSPAQIQKQYDLYEGNPLKDQVLHGKFVFGGDNIYDSESILDAEDTTLNDGERRLDGEKYTLGIDTAIGSDEMVYSMLKTTSKPYKLVRQIACKGNSKSPQMHLNDLLDLIESYSEYKDGNNLNNVQLMLETWNGESVRFYLELPPSVQYRTRCYGSWQPEVKKTDNKNQLTKRNKEAKKADILLALKKLLSSRDLKIPNDPNLVQQLSIYREKDDNIPTDRVIALALACWLAQETAPLQAEIQYIDW
jgi:hypothetical protein